MEINKEKRWNLQDAKARLSELVDLAQSGNAQIILRRGAPAAAVVSIAQYEATRPRRSLIAVLLQSPLLHSQLDLTHADALDEIKRGVFDEVDGP